MSSSSPSLQPSHSTASQTVIPAAPFGIGPLTAAGGNDKPRQLERTTIWNVPFDQVTVAEAVDYIGQLVECGTAQYVITANLNYVMLNHRDPEMRPITHDAALVLADGQPIVWRSKLGKARLPERVAGSELIFDLANLASRNRWGIYFLGGEPGVAEKCAARLSREYPGMRVAGIESPPFRKLSAEEQLQQDKRIKASGAQILLIAFGQPKGEKWIHENHQRLGIPVSVQLGASFDFIAGTAKRSPRIWRRIGMEWLYRMLSDPRRLVPRYAANAAFLFSALVEDWKQTVTGWGMGDWSNES